MKEGKVVMTGGTGFILSQVAEKLIEMGKDVTLFDNNEQHNMYEETQKLLEEKDNFHFVQGDTRDKAAVEDVIKDAETVYHFAALMGTSSRFKQEVETVEVNVIGTLNVLQASLDTGVKYYVHPPRPPLSVWLTPYIISKGAQTQFTQMFHKVYGLPTIGLNIQNCYGARERAILNPNTYRPGEGRKFMASAIIAALKNEPIPVFGDGEQSSDWVHIDDIVEALVLAPCDAAVGQVMDFGVGESITINKIAQIVIEMTKSKSKIEHLPMRTGEAKVHTKADNAPAKEYLGWEPKIDLREGLKRTIPYFAKSLGIESPV
ncbi:SDR family NAD(P)-dependent oxidoreductase [Desulfotignum phosphitoxidans]|uniref:WcaG-like protein n=3 Tax=Desulfotignum phosphitoxidans TaxID=190898 RepID=D3JWU4_9BACT|nr:SDR family NAD(P)-dependent oxidoreductase [Desulfotignum phosphitoxidans]ADB92514.1 WcaG-like protein [Desulfotignum phosphitoxidans DSM 13687]EMS77982.1 putative epimerase/dehydratase PtdF [Desulfotignum phosphitoxidans DSM 13687]